MLAGMRQYPPVRTRGGLPCTRCGATCAKFTQQCSNVVSCLGAGSQHGRKVALPSHEVWVHTMGQSSVMLCRLSTCCWFLLPVCRVYRQRNHGGVGGLSCASRACIGTGLADPNESRPISSICVLLQRAV